MPLLEVYPKSLCLARSIGPSVPDTMRASLCRDSGANEALKAEDSEISIERDMQHQLKASSNIPLTTPLCSYVRR
jgi:hypothetical protein